MWRESRLLLWSPLVIQHLKCHVRNASLLQNDRDVDTRNTNLQNARTKYQLEQKTFNLLEDQRVQVNLVDIPPLVSIYVIMGLIFYLEISEYTQVFLPNKEDPTVPV